MSGGHWNYQQYAIEETADRMHDLLKTLARVEHIMDWALSCDTSIAGAKEEVWAQWEGFFDRNSFR